MARSNRISAVFREGQKEDVIADINRVKESLPFLISLTAEERKTLRKMGPKSVDYVRHCLAAAKAHPEELKRSFDVDEMEKDFVLINNLLDVQVVCQGLLELIDDTMMAAGVDAMDASDELYESLKSSAKKDANVKALVERISDRFKGQGKKKKTDE